MASATDTELTRLTRAELFEDITRAMSPPPGGDGNLRVGIEVEMIPLLEDGSRLPLTDLPGAPSGEALLLAAAASNGWSLGSTRHGTPSAAVPGVGIFTFEPGGQLELSSVPLRSIGRLADGVRGAVRALDGTAQAMGISLSHIGMARTGNLEDVGLQVTSARYVKQAAHYDAIGPWGRRMMCQSAAIHVNVDFGGRVMRRWWVANRIAPYMTALFANSPGTCSTGSLRSERAEQWRHLDPSRTGVIDGGDDPSAAYFHFAVEAMDFLTPEPGSATPFRTTWGNGGNRDAWQAHLTTLFPEVRPRGYLELRSFDALRPAWYAVPLVITAGLLYDPDGLSEAERILTPVSHDILLRAGRAGMGDGDLRCVAEQLFDIGLEGAARLGEDIVGTRDREVAQLFGERLVRQGADPGGEARATDPFEP